jgi:hypothetical protein
LHHEALFHKDAEWVRLIRFEWATVLIAIARIQRDSLMVEDASFAPKYTHPLGSHARLDEVKECSPTP